MQILVHFLVLARNTLVTAPVNLLPHKTCVVLAFAEARGS